MTFALLAACVLASAVALLRVRTNRRALPLALVVLVVCASIATLEGRLALREHRWSVATSSLLGVDVEVHCQRMIAYAVDTSVILGFVPSDPITGEPMREAWLRRDTCDSLAKWDHESPTDEHVRAVHVLTHEAMHMAGERNEARTECYAIQRNAAMAVVLGASADQAKRLSLRYHKQIHHKLPLEYQSRECREGGAWDENLKTSPWNIEKERGITDPDTPRA